MGKYEYLKMLAEPKHEIPVPAFVEASRIVATDQAFVRAMVGEGPYAVRSSCDDEDAYDTAQAGRYTSLIGVPFESLPDAIKKVRSSYGTAHGKVIVQQAIDAVMSGVAFSSSPEGFLGEMVVTFGKGLGEGVVSDTSDTVTYHLSYDGTCVWMSGALPDGEGTGKHDAVGEGKGDAVGASVDSSSLSSVVDEVQRLCKKCAEAIGAEADVEFAVDAAGKVWILQARPITRIAGMGQDDALRCEELLDSSNIIESYPGVVLPLTQTFASGVYRRIFTAAVDRLTGTRELSSRMAHDLEHMLVFSDWHAYYRLASWYAVLSIIPFSGFVKKAWRSSLGVEHERGDEGLTSAVPKTVKGTVLRNFFRYLKASPDEVDAICEKIKPVLDEGRQHVDATDNPMELLRLVERIENEVLSCWDLTLFNDIYTFVWTFLSGNKAKRVASAQRELDSMRPVRAMRTLVAVAQEHGMTGEEYATARETFLSTYGDRAPGELKLETRTWRSNPESLDAYVASLVDKGGRDTEHDTETHKSALVANDERSGRVKGFAMRNALKGAAMRERSRLMRTEMFGLVRSCYDKIGVTLERSSVIESPEDVYYLTTQEVADAVRRQADLHGSGEATGNMVDLHGSGEAVGNMVDLHGSGEAVGNMVDLRDSGKATGNMVDLREVVRERKLHEALLANAPAPKTVRVCGPKPWDHTAGSLGAQLHAISWREDGTATGTGTSPGCFTGTAVVVRGKETAQSTNGKVIVAVSTDPGWAYLLDGAGAIIAERGSLLSHTAIISRELGIPSVVGVKDATTQMRTGDIVEVDGSRGIVRIVSRGEMN